MSSPNEGRFDRWLSRPATSFVGVLAGALLALPSLGGGFYADDDALIGYLDNRFAFNPAWYDLYRFVPASGAGILQMIARGQVPWWTTPSLRLHLVRPLTSALFTLEHAVFGSSPVWYHLDSIAWWVLLLAGLRALYRRLLPAQTAAIGVLLFAVSNAAVFPYAWISARHALVAAAPAVIGLVAAVRAREGWAPGRWIAPLAMIVGLAGGEMALGGLAFWVSYELFGPARPAAWKARIERALVPVAIGLAYLALYAAAGGGAHASGGYVDPATPGTFAIVATKRYPALLAASLLGAPAELATVLPAAPVVALGVAGAAGAFFLWRACAPLAVAQERAAIRWLVPGALVAMLGAVGGFPGSREVLLANVAWAALFAIVLRHGFRAGASSLPRRAGAAVVLVFHLVLAPLVAIGGATKMMRVAREVAAIAHAPPLAAGPPDRIVVIAQASDPMAFMYPLARLAREGEKERSPGACFTLLSAAKGDTRITRTGADTLAIEPLSGSMLKGPFETLFRAGDLPFRQGDEARTCAGTVRVVAVDAGGRPARIEARLKVALDDPRVRVLAWKEGALRPLSLAIGEPEEVRWTPGPIGFF